VDEPVSKGVADSLGAGHGRRSLVYSSVGQMEDVVFKEELNNSGN